MSEDAKEQLAAENQTSRITSQETKLENQDTEQEWRSLKDGTQEATKNKSNIKIHWLQKYPVSQKCFNN